MSSILTERSILLALCQPKLSLVNDNLSKDKVSQYEEGKGKEKKRRDQTGLRECRLRGVYWTITRMKMKTKEENKQTKKDGNWPKRPGLQIHRLKSRVTYPVNKGCDENVFWDDTLYRISIFFPRKGGIKKSSYLINGLAIHDDACCFQYGAHQSEVLTLSTLFLQT